ncbi:hypothetical protein UFOVP276_229 [uncultured Caudovirales phage]|uniref:Uncharacterized protein n=1 Tax=uncultured Caudovirales phage TaxID=2100421 RepID=A0A6J5LIN9_9CAUD|nr:hypothetical protein UFOVP127_123 [uncultured Caudovirales phage]CAB4135273.1 hypothetical protein UFOVP276_229 [uncultured Caudovirales phage]
MVPTLLLSIILSLSPTTPDDTTIYTLRYPNPYEVAEEKPNRAEMELISDLFEEDRINTYYEGVATQMISEFSAGVFTLAKP